MAVMSIKYSKGTCLAHLVVLLYRGHSSLLCVIFRCRSTILNGYGLDMVTSE